jgi:hypothetical protein
MRLTSAGAPRFSVDGRFVGVTWDGDRADLLEVTPSREYRTLVPGAWPGAAGYRLGDFSPDGRLLAVALDSGARLWDIQSGRELAALPAGTNHVFFDCVRRQEAGVTGEHDCHAGLLTCGSHGLLRWAISNNSRAGTHIRLGPPKQLSTLQRACFARGPDGRTLAAVTEAGTANKILDLETATVRLELHQHPGGEIRALSPDGKWAASCGWHSERVRLWSLETGQMVHEWSPGKQNHAFFTPNSQELIIARGDEFSFWNVETFQPTRRLRREVPLYPGHVAFSPDGKLMALEMSPGSMHLLDVTTARTVAKLEDPHGDRATWQGFSPDGSQLAVAAGYASAVHVWDLRAIRARLKRMNLDWDWPEFPEKDQHPRQDSVWPVTGAKAWADEPQERESDRERFGPMTVEVVQPSIANVTPTYEERVRRSLARCRAELDANPSAHNLNRMAWLLVMAPQSLRNTSEAVSLAEKAVQLDSRPASYRNTLGAAYYRAGRYREAVAVLRDNLTSEADDELAIDLYVLAMCHHYLGDTARARDHYDLAVRWAKLHQTRWAMEPELLATLRREAEEILGIP